MAGKKLWFSVYDRGDYKGDEPAFFDASQFDWAEKIKADYPLIKKELEDFLQNRNLINYFNSTMVEKANSWKTISMKWWGLEVYRHQSYFKKTTQSINQIPGVVSASFNMLDANSSIKPHHGDTNGIFRCHLGLIVPAGLPECGFRVEDVTRPWKEGEWLIFVDALNHEAWNRSIGKRYILVVDEVRPEFISRKNMICSTVLTSLFLQKSAERFKFLYRLPEWTQRVMAKTLRPFSYPASWARNLASRLGIVD